MKFCSTAKLKFIALLDSLIIPSVTDEWFHVKFQQEFMLSKHVHSSSHAGPSMKLL